jgi:hypothetical protein
MISKDPATCTASFPRSIASDKDTLKRAGGLGSCEHCALAAARHLGKPVPGACWERTIHRHADDRLLHGSAKTTYAVRAAIQRSKASIQELASRYDLNPKTVMKWRKRAFLYDAPMGPKVPRSTVLSAEEEALAVAFRKHTLFAFMPLQATIPHLTRSSLHRRPGQSCASPPVAKGATRCQAVRFSRAWSLSHRGSRNIGSACQIQ